MTTFRQLRQKMKAFYGRYSSLLNIIFKFVLAFLSFMALAHFIGGVGLFSNIFLILILALLSSIMPLAAIPVFGGILLVGMAWSLGYDAAAMAAIVLLVLLVMFLRFAPESSLLLILVPASLYFGVPQVVPVCAGLKMKMSSILGTGCGVVVYYLIKTLAGLGENTSSGGTSDMMSRLQNMANGIFGQNEMILNLLILCGIFVIVYAIRRLSIKYSWCLAVVIGSVIYPVFMMVGGLLSGSSFSVLVLVLATPVSILTSLVFVFFFFDVDYQRTEYLQFEDDAYYYYVKAIPKIAVKEGRHEEEAFSDQLAENAGVNPDDPFNDHVN